MRYHLPLAVGLLCVALHAAPAAQLPASCQWIGNDFPGIGENGAGEWVQDAIVLTTSTWDEAGRCTGLYKDGAVNHVLIQQTKGERKAWGWGTAGTAVAVAGERFLILNTEGELLRFSWKPGDLNSAQQVDQVRIGAGTCLAVRGGRPFDRPSRRRWQRARGGHRPFLHAVSHRHRSQGTAGGVRQWPPAAGAGLRHLGATQAAGDIRR